MLLKNKKSKILNRALGKIPSVNQMKICCWINMCYLTDPTDKNSNKNSQQIKNQNEKKIIYFFLIYLHILYIGMKYLIVT